MDEVLCSFIYSYIQCPLYNHNWTLVKLCVCYPNKHYKYLQYSRKITTCEIVKIINNHDNDIKREGSAMSEWRNDVTCPLTRLPRPLWHADDGFLLSVKHFLPVFAGQQLSHYLAKLLWPLSHACGSFSLIPIFISGFKIWGKINRFLHKICSCFHFMKKYMLRMVKNAIWTLHLYFRYNLCHHRVQWYDIITELLQAPVCQ